MMTSTRAGLSVRCVRWLGCGALLLGASLACSTKAQNGSRLSRADGGSSSAGGADGNSGTGSGAAVAGSFTLCVDNSCGGALNMNSGSKCGDGTLTDDEACDDGNTVSGDGCSANCLMVEVGYSCAIAGQPCGHIAKCGDGVATDPEICDDGNTMAGDGCSPRCTLELGFKCSGTPSACTPTTCGDGI